MAGIPKDGNEKKGGNEHKRNRRTNTAIHSCGNSSRLLDKTIAPYYGVSIENNHLNKETWVNE